MVAAFRRAARKIQNPPENALVFIVGQQFDRFCRGFECRVDLPSRDIQSGDSTVRGRF